MNVLLSALNRSSTDNPIARLEGLPGSIEHVRLRELLVAARKGAGLTQEAVAERLGRPQSFVAKYEGGERRIDVIEFIEIVRALEGDPREMFEEVLRSSQAGRPPAGK